MAIAPRRPDTAPRGSKVAPCGTTLPAAPNGRSPFFSAAATSPPPNTNWTLPARRSTARSMNARTRSGCAARRDEDARLALTVE